MTTISQIGQSSAQLKNSQLSNSKLWQKKTNDVYPLDLTLFIQKMKMKGLKDEAIRAVEELQRLTLLALLEGKIKDAPYLAYSGEKVRMTLGDFACILTFSNLSDERQKAILFALETGMKPEDVITITWSMVRRMPLSKLASAIVESFPRNLHVNYVFWEKFEAFDMVGPMFGLSQDFQDLFSGMSFHETWRLFQEAAPVNSYEDAIDFQKLFLSNLDAK